MGDINDKIKEIRDNVLSQLKISKIKKNVATEDIIQIIFEGKNNKILAGFNKFQRVVISNTDDVIEKYLNVNLEKKLSEESNNMNDFLKILEEIRSILGNFSDFNIPIYKILEYIYITF